LVDSITGYQAWTALMVGHPDWLAPFMHIGTSEGLALIDKDDSAEHWTHATPRFRRVARPTGNGLL
jgi:hypothetical protein